MNGLHLMLTTTARAAMAVVLICTVTGCSGFHRQWNRTLALAPAPAGIEGAWEGEWQSERNQHHGRLRCLIQLQSENTYEAFFNARFWKIFQYSYRIPLQVDRVGNGESFAFHGKADLGWLAGGVYTYRGQATLTNFHSSYECGRDHGVFKMSKVFAAPEAPGRGANADLQPAVVVYQSPITGGQPSPVTIKAAAFVCFGGLESEY